MQQKFLDSPEQPFSPDEIYLQLQKIVQDPVLENSLILKNFLQYIVEESIQGNSNRLKEYTIAVNVLHKPIDFNTQENGIVRIHAARLRRILDVYYKGHGVIDFIRISIPKGTYIPHFSKNTNGHLFRDPAAVKEPVVIGVIPFSYLSADEADRSILRGIELHLTTALMEFENVFVVGFQIISEILRKEKDIKKLISDYGMHYILMGEANVLKDNLRLFVHLIKSRSHQQVWAQMYERKIMKNNYFQIQDDVVSSVLPQLANFLA
jgi:TolB-like protein